MTDYKCNLAMSSKHQNTSSINESSAESVVVRVYPNGETEKTSPAFLRRYGKTYSPYGNLTPDLRKYGKTYSGRINLKQESSSDHSSQNESEKPVVGHGESVGADIAAPAQASMTTDAKSYTLNKVSVKNDSTGLKNVIIKDHVSKLGDGSRGQNINELATQNIKLPCDKPVKKMILLNDSNIVKNDLTGSKKVIIKDHSSKSGGGSKERNIIQLATKMCDKPAKKMIVLNDSGSGKPVVLYLVPNSEATSSSSVSNSPNKDNTNAAVGKAPLKYQPALVDKYHGPSGSIILLDRTMSSSVGLVQKDLALQRKNTLSVSAGKGDTLINTPGGKVPSMYQPIRVDKNRAPGGSIILVDQTRSGSVSIVQKGSASQGKTTVPISIGKEDGQIKTVANEKSNSDTLDLQSQKSAIGSLKQLREKDILPVTVSKKRIHPNTVDPQLQNYVLDVPKSRDNSLNEITKKISKETLVSLSNSTESDSVPCKKYRKLSSTTMEISVKTDSDRNISELENSNSCPKLGILDDTKSTSKENDNSINFSYSSQPLKKKSIDSTFENDTIVKKMKKKKKKEKEKQVTKKVKKRKLKPIATEPTGVVGLNVAPSRIDDNENVKKIPKKKKKLEQKKLIKKKKLLESQNKGKISKLEKQMKKFFKKKVKISDPIYNDITKDTSITGSLPLPKLEKYLSVVPKEQKSAIETCEKVNSDGMPVLEDATKIIPLLGDDFQTMPILQELEKTCPLMALSPHKLEEMDRNLSPRMKKKTESSTKTKKLKSPTDTDMKKPKLSNLSTDSKKERPKMSVLLTDDNTEKAVKSKLSTKTSTEKPKISKLSTDTTKEKPDQLKLLTGTEKPQALKLTPDTNLSKLSNDIKIEKPKLPMSSANTEKMKLSKLSTDIMTEKPKLSIGKEESNSTIDKNTVVPNMLKLSKDTDINNPELSKSLTYTYIKKVTMPKLSSDSSIEKLKLSSVDINRTKPKLSSRSTDTEKISLLNDSSKEKHKLLKSITDTKTEMPKSSKLSTANDEVKAKLSIDTCKEKPKLSTDTRTETPKTSKLSIDNNKEKAKLSIDTSKEKSKLSTDTKTERPKSSKFSIDNNKEKAKLSIDTSKENPKLSTDSKTETAKSSKLSTDNDKEKAHLSTDSKKETLKLSTENDKEKSKLSTDSKTEKPKLSKSIETKTEKSKLSNLTTENDKEKAKLSIDTCKEKSKLSTDAKTEKPKLSKSIETKTEKPKLSKLTTENDKEKAKLSIDTCKEKSKLSTDAKTEKPKLSNSIETKTEKPKFSTENIKEKADLSIDTGIEKPKLSTDTKKETAKLSKLLTANDIEKSKTDCEKEKPNLPKLLTESLPVSFRQRNSPSEGDNLKCSHSNSATEVKGENSSNLSSDDVSKKINRPALINVLKFGKTLESTKNDNTLDPPKTTENEISYSAILTQLIQYKNFTSTPTPIPLNTKQIPKISALDTSAGTMQTPVLPAVSVSSAMTFTPQNSTLTTSDSQDIKNDVSSDIPHAISKSPVSIKTENDVTPPTNNVPLDVLTNRQYSAVDVLTKDSAIPSKSPSDSFSANSATGDATLATAETDDDSSNLHLYLSPEHREESSNFDLLPHPEHNLDPKPRKLCLKHKEKLTKLSCRKKTDGEFSCTYTSCKCNNCLTTGTNKCLACYSCQNSELSKKDYQSPRRNLPSEKCCGEMNTQSQLSCNVCLCPFTNRSDLEVHMKWHVGTKQPKHSLCGKTPQQEDDQRGHTQKHIGERRYQCSYCQKGFSSKGILRVHVRSHTGEKPFKCPDCPSQFAESGCLAVHLADHQNKYSQLSSLHEIENLDSLPSQPQNENNDICDSEETRLPSTSSPALCSSASESAKALAIARQEKRQSRMRMLQTYLAGEDVANVGIDKANKVVPTSESQDPVSTLAPKLLESHKDSEKRAPSPAAEPVSPSLPQIKIDSQTMSSENDHKANEVDMNLKVGRSFSLGIKDYQAIGSVKQEVQDPNALKIDHIKTEPTTETAPSGQELLVSDLPPPLLSPQNVSPVTHGDKTSTLLLKMEDPPLLPKVMSFTSLECNMKNVNLKNPTSGISTPGIGGTLCNLTKEPVSASVPALSQNHEIGTTPSAVNNTVNEVFIKKEVIEEKDRKEWESLEKPDDITSNTFHEQERVIFLPTGGQNSSSQSRSMHIVDWPRTIVQCSVEEQPDDVNKIQQAKSSHDQSGGTCSSGKKSNKMDSKMKTNDISKKRKLSDEDENLTSSVSPPSSNGAKKHCSNSENVQPTVEIEVLSEDPVEIKQEIYSGIDGISNTSKDDNVSPSKSISSDQDSLDDESQRIKKESYGMSKRNLSRLPSEPIRHLPKRNYKKPQKYFCDDFDYSISLSPMKAKTSNPVSGVTPTTTDNSIVTVSSPSQLQSVSCDLFEKNSSHQTDKSNENCKQSDKTNAANKNIVNNNNKSNDKTKKSDNNKNNKNNKKNNDVDEKNKNDSKNPKKKLNSNSPIKESTEDSASANDAVSIQRTRRRYDMTKRLLKKELMDKEKELKSRDAVSKNFLRLRFKMPESAGEFELQQQYHKKKLLKNATVKKHTIIPKTAKARKSPRTSPKKCSESHYGLAKMAQADQRPFLSVVTSERKILPGPRPKTLREEIMENLMSFSSANFVANDDASSNLKQNNSDEIDVRTEPTQLSKLLGTPLTILPSGAAPQPPLAHPITTVASHCKNSSIKTIAAFIPVTLSGTPKNMPIPVTVLANPLHSGPNQQNNQFFMGNFPAHPQEKTVPAPLPEKTVPAPLPEKTVPAPLPEKTVLALLPEDTVPAPLPEKTEPAPLPEDTIPVPLSENTVPVPLPENAVTTPQPENAVPTLLSETTILTPLPANIVPTLLPEDTVLDQKPVISQLLPLPEIKPKIDYEPMENIFPIPVLQIKNEVTFDDEAYGGKQSDGLSGLRITGVTGGVTTHDTIPTNSDAICTTAMLANSHENDPDEGTPQDWSVTRRRPLRCTLVQTEDGLGRSDFTFECCGLSFSQIPKLASHLDSCHK